MKTLKLRSDSGAGLVALTRWSRGIARSRTTIWRWVQRGWLTPINIAGRLYLRLEDIEQFENRAIAGEFARANPTPRNHKMESQNKSAPARARHSNRNQI